MFYRFSRAVWPLLAVLAIIGCRVQAPPPDASADATAPGILPELPEPPHKYGAALPFAYPVVPAGGSVGDLCSVSSSTTPSVCSVAHVSNGTLAVGHGGTGDTTLTAHGVLVGEGSSAVSQVGPGSSGVPLLGAGGSADPAFGALSLAGGSGVVTGTLPVGNGGTNATSFTAHGLVVGESSSLSSMAACGSGVPVLGAGSSADPTCSALNLGGGSSVVTGTLPAGNQASQSIGGDGTGTTAALDVTGLENKALPSLATGYLNYTGSAWALSAISVSVGNIANGTEGQAIFAGASVPAWTTFSGDFTCSGATPGLCSVASITGSSSSVNISAAQTVLNNGGTSGQQVIGGLGTAQTTSTSAVNISAPDLPFAHPNNVVTDWSVTCVGRNTSNNGDIYRADYVFTYQRFTSGAPALVGAASPLNIRTNGGGSGYGGITTTTSSNTVDLQVTGATSTTVDWVCAYQITEDTWLRLEDLLRAAKPSNDVLPADAYPDRPTQSEEIAA